MKLARLLEDRKELLKLQQRLIDDLPDEIEIGLISHDKLGDIICCKYRSPRDERMMFFKPHVTDKLLYAMRNSLAWTAVMDYRTVLIMLKGWLD